MKRIICSQLFAILLLFTTQLDAQSTIQGEVLDITNNEALIGATILIKESTTGTTTDYDGSFSMKVPELPVTVTVSYLGYEAKDFVIDSEGEQILKLGEDAVNLVEVEVVGQGVSEKAKAAPLTVESLDLKAIKETPAENFYDGLGALKGVDLTAASLGFKVINTRGFNSTSPVRSLQVIDGVDNQAPGLNFSLGNFLGSSELDVVKVDILQGAASAYYGPNAFNGVIAMETKNPFLHKGLSASLKAGERNMYKAEVRWADALKNKDGNDFMAYKLNFSYLQADDWEATNETPVDGTESIFGNPGGWDKVNTYGDEYFSLNDFSADANLINNAAGLGIFHRTGYDELDLVDYNTQNMKANVAVHFKTKPSEEFTSPEFIISSSVGSGTTVYQGDNRFSLKNILFFQNRLEFRKKDKYFIRAYATNEDAGDSYDPYFTALRLQEASKSNEEWGLNYTEYWLEQGFVGQMQETGYPTPSVDPNTGQLIFDFDAANSWLGNNQDILSGFHAAAAAFADQKSPQLDDSQDFFVPGTERFQQKFDEIRSLKNTEGGTLIYDKSALYHLHGEYKFETSLLDEIKVGANYRLYRPVTDGTVFNDADTQITNSEFGVYSGFQKKFTRKLTFTGTLRMDKNENFDYIFTPAATMVYSPDVYNYFRMSFSSGVRNPTLADQYLDFDVGRATLKGNLEGYYDLITLESFVDYLGSSFQAPLDTLNIDPIKPESVRTFEVGYRTTLFKKLYLDGSYYFNIYNNFIGYNLGVETSLDAQTGFPLPNTTEVYRVAANSTNDVTTQGFSIGAFYYFQKYYKFSGNYSFNRLVKVDEDDPIIPAYNTPEHKYNLGISGRGIPMNIGNFVKDIGFSVNYKWVEGFLFEGSPQFTGFIEDYGLLDAQVSFNMKKINTILKIGASNILDNKVNQTYGGPEIGRLGYISLLYEFKKQ